MPRCWKTGAKFQVSFATKFDSWCVRISRRSLAEFLRYNNSQRLCVFNRWFLSFLGKFFGRSFPWPSRRKISVSFKKPILGACFVLVIVCEIPTFFARNKRFGIKAASVVRRDCLISPRPGPKKATDLWPFAKNESVGLERSADASRFCRRCSCSELVSWLMTQVLRM